MTTCTKPHSEPWARVANFGTEGQETIGTYKTFAEAQDAAANYGGVLAQRVLADNGDWSLVVVKL